VPAGADERLVDAACAGPQTVLTLFADYNYRLGTDGDEAPACDICRWAREADGTLLLRGGREAPLRLSPAAGGVQRWPVRIDGGRCILATLEGRFVMHEPEPALPPREAIVVERFERLWPDETCAADAPGNAALLNTRWRLIEIDRVHWVEPRLATLRSPCRTDGATQPFGEPG
jgi:hypothetical protein